MSDKLRQLIDQVRSFNRSYTRVVGLLDEGLAGSSFGLTETRVMFELAAAESLEIQTLRNRLLLDAGYTTRILDRLTERGLIRRDQSVRDRRRQVVSLTKAGRATFAELDQLNAEAVARLLDPLSPAERDRLVAAMAVVGRLLDRESVSAASSLQKLVRLREPGPGELGWIVERHGLRYAEECAWGCEFEALVARVVADFAANPRLGRAWIAEVDSRPAGSVLCVRSDADPETALLRLLLVEPWARGLGLGDQLVRACVDFARDAGFARLDLWTTDVQADAGRLYRRVGFVLINEQPEHRFGVDLTAQSWRLELSSVRDLGSAQPPLDRR